MDWTKQGGSMAEGYQGFLVPAMFEPCAEAVLDAAGLRPGADVLDVECGTGAMSRAAAARVGPDGSVVGVDLAPPMLEIARTQGGDRIEYRQGDALALPVDDAAFDVAICQHGFQFFPDRPAALGEMVRALRPGGQVAIACWTRLDDSPSFTVMIPALVAALGEEQAGAMRMPFSVGPDDLEALLDGAGLDDVTVREAEVPAAFAGEPGEVATRAIMSGPLGAQFQELPQEDRDAFAAQVGGDLAGYADDGYLRVPMFTTIATAQTPA